ncbi:MAG: hypothetical protein KC503_04670 [Myxococcales bacterium]|nr:hypothetical protein [Myxococcales bacterium]
MWLEGNVLYYVDPPHPCLESVEVMMRRSRELTRGLRRWFMVIDLGQVERRVSPRTLAAIIKHAATLEAELIAVHSVQAPRLLAAAVRMVVRALSGRAALCADEAEARRAVQLLSGGARGTD